MQIMYFSHFMKIRKTLALQIWICVVSSFTWTNQDVALPCTSGIGDPSARDNKTLVNRSGIVS